MTDKISFLKFRNTHGEVLVAYKETENGIHAGYAFCNPADFNLPRKIRIVKGHGIAVSRIEGSVLMPCHVSAFEGKHAHAEFRNYMLEFALNQKAVIVDTYRGAATKNRFQEWFVPFMELERKKFHALQTENKKT